MSDHSGQNGKDWEKHKMHVLSEIGRLDNNIRELWDNVGDITSKDIPETRDAISKQIGELKDFLTKKFERINADIIKLNVKSGLWGAAAGMIPAVMVLIVMFMKSGA